jgi:hypothetical protein
MRRRLEKLGGHRLRPLDEAASLQWRLTNAGITPTTFNARIVALRSFSSALHRRRRSIRSRTSPASTSPDLSGRR